jgi:phosphate transport system substrate-binding protein
MRFDSRWLHALVILASAWTSVVAADKQTLSAAPGDADLHLHGAVVLGGSVALADLAGLWVQGFRQVYPLVEVTLSDAGGEAGIAALENGIADAVLLGGWPTASQLEALKNRYGYTPTLIPVAMDAVAVYVNAQNPLRQITLAQLDGIFSATHRCGEAAIGDWRQLGVPADAGLSSIVAYGLDDSTSAYLVFRQVALCDGDFRPEFQAVAGPDAVASAVATQSGAIGFSSSALGAASLRPLDVARDHSARAIPPDAEAIRSKRYPMSRTLLIAVNVSAGKPLPPLLQALVTYVLSPDGQKMAQRAGYVSLSP